MLKKTKDIDETNPAKQPGSKQICSSTAHSLQTVDYIINVIPAKIQTIEDPEENSQIDSIGKIINDNERFTYIKTENHPEPLHFPQINLEPSTTNIENNNYHTELETILNQSATTFMEEIHILRTEIGKENNRLIRTFDKKVDELNKSKKELKLQVELLNAHVVNKQPQDNMSEATKRLEALEKQISELKSTQVI